MDQKWLFGGIIASHSGLYDMVLTLWLYHIRPFNLTQISREVNIYFKKHDAPNFSNMQIWRQRAFSPKSPNGTK